MIEAPFNFNFSLPEAVSGQGWYGEGNQDQRHHKQETQTWETQKLAFDKKNCVLKFIRIGTYGRIANKTKLRVIPKNPGMVAWWALLRPCSRITLNIILTDIVSNKFVENLEKATIKS